MEAQIRALQRDVDILQRKRIRDEDRLMSHIQHEHGRFKELVRTIETGPQDGPADKMPPKRTTTSMSDAAIKALVARSVADALAKHKANKSKNGDDNHDSGTGSRRTERAARVVGLTHWFEKMESNSHVKTVGNDAAYGMPWKTLKKMMTDKYCPRGEIKKLEIELMFPDESDEVEKYVGGLPDMIQGSVMASKPKTMQDEIEFATEMMHQKIRTFADHQAENKRNLDDNSRSNQN
ncbi:hypothetical protein Tco_1188010 [Tanacetum coccineum]